MGIRAFYRMYHGIKTNDMLKVICAKMSQKRLFFIGIVSQFVAMMYFSGRYAPETEDPSSSTQDQSPFEQHMNKCGRHPLSMFIMMVFFGSIVFAIWNCVINKWLNLTKSLRQSNMPMIAH